eukprot:CAMPEP_0183314130 /NCGR_PEP_ID=MMETSP0160_2-20130417/47521_1 /TAXON_ID=2839 ORGANISM="Odontella Sinensis, Strain Grunow 1884" /NCGR_SAMPLE_ID=MMETSP0160_2 /ASSEMBLY_ACC=CAM_ASM_000250 /LENGTH=46 /DNA_ID= /DNA_START= /DNA_END= /DNA_ORIENTATION=
MSAAVAAKDEGTDKGKGSNGVDTLSVDIVAPLRILAELQHNLLVDN